ncbi:MAG TPA: GNAT family N-acetyltransferase [Phenylobacterium sp.]|nr:GNAT family N-acetyltransferase [Phenylobacterium sp.]
MILVREARLEELPIAASIYQRTLRDTFTWLPAWRHNAQDFLRAAADEEIYVAVADARIVGVAAFFRPDNFLHSLYVAERGLGVGKALLDHIVGVATGPVSLKCQAQNLRAQAFYAREGFQAVEHGRDPPSGPPWVRMLDMR